ncbi:hypothetical protein HPT25_03915 [Bacillus sp. BRMEA1]|uniref:hypothetical protein n=1 Tax=Neobacillus endophyticus TaxID=2738405 RepID=UPI001563E1C6|nr:hypothetical protein [Neobacillus endophyticus]NRD76636.1 hypothetical protein [Neobacillus endophyticus]
MPNRLAIVLLITVIVSSVLLGCTESQSKEENINPIVKINQIVNIENSEVTKIVFFDGRGGRNKPFALTDKQKIEGFMKMIDNYKIQKEIKHKDFTGWIHKANFYMGNKKLMGITFTKPLEIDGKYYDIIKGKLSTEEIDNFIKSANPDWKLQ